MQQQRLVVLCEGSRGRAGHLGQGEKPGQPQGDNKVRAGADHKFQEDELSDDSLPLYAFITVIINSRYITNQQDAAQIVVSQLLEPLCAQ